MNSIETHSYKNWTIEIYQKEASLFGYRCYQSNGEEEQSEGYDKTQYALEAAQNYIDNQTATTSTLHPAKEVGSPTEDEVTPTEDLNDL